MSLGQTEFGLYGVIVGLMAFMAMYIAKQYREELFCRMEEME